MSRAAVAVASAAAALACHAGACRAQVAASVAIDSDDRLRGISLSDGRPVANLNLSWDSPSGIYVGASAGAVATGRDGLRWLGDTVLVGYARRFGAGASWDVGVSNSLVADYAGGAKRIDYSELYGGLTAKGLSAHLYYSPSYLGSGAQTLYAEVNGAVRPATAWRLFAHAGVLTSLGGANVAYAGHTRYDARAGVARAFGGFELSLAATTTTPGIEFPEGHAQSRTALILSAAYAF
ncbi:MAG TPA: TorF family putative porin [Caulobacteraceae bacterium]|jgi:uncharacterized protein (TIGR02001 family)|nr:TorF family putative porin [Caulobacteraceae bacterium]